MPRHSLPPGFTLIELALTLVLFALLAGIAVPSFSRTMSRARVNSALNVLAGEIFLARSLAARDSRPLSIRFDPADTCADRYLIVDDTGGVLRRVTTSRERSGVCLTSNVERAMRVNSRGMLVGSPRRIRAESGGEADSMTVSIVGRVYRRR
jgi:prepilin-type N-terminal cleavage/methylation domain-containing protein